MLNVLLPKHLHAISTTDHASITLQQSGMKSHITQNGRFIYAKLWK